MNIAVIPARGGSQRIPMKNIKAFNGKPMLAWSVEAALESGCFDQVVVSTDHAGIAAVAREHGASVPFLRPAELSGDKVGTIPVIAHAIDWFRQQGQQPDNVCCIYATAPFVRAEDIRNGLDVLENNRCDYAFSVTSFAFPVQRAIRITSDNRVEMLYPEHYHSRSQDLVEAFHDAGQFYWGTAQAWLEQRVIFSSSSCPVVLPRHRVQDIDTDEDWIRAEWLFRALQAEGGR
ncbi:MAG TPA: pseudaminic acid cytidylyltransferase [Dongiaceae bacterium]|nr:pseudaminic acid cytidylyltransferase [Dongiaceae bacterium]